SRATVIDPVCGMQVDPTTAAGSHEYAGTDYYFCSEHCRQKFVQSPESFLGSSSAIAESDGHRHSCCHSEAASPHDHSHTEEHSSGVKPSSSAAYYCPMCPGVESDRPGTCPKCGMALERATPQRPTTRTVYTCPMHPEIEQDHP